MEVPNTRKTIKEPKVTVHIVLGKATECRQRLLRLFWLRLLATGQSDTKGENKTKV